MITGIAVVPGALAMLPEYVGRIDPIADLRASAQRSVDAVAAEPDQVIVITSADAEPRHSRRSVGERVAAHLLQVHLGREPTKVAVLPTNASAAMVSEIAAVLGPSDDPRGPSTGLVVVADGSATRTEKSPGHLHPRAIEFDDALVAAVRHLDVDGLLALDIDLALEVRALGRAPLQVMAVAMGDPTAYTCEEFVTDDSLGVLLLAARFARGTQGSERSSVGPTRAV